MTDSEFLVWVADRLVHVHGDPEHIDFVLKLRRMAAAVLPQEAGAPPTIRIGEPEDEIVCGDFHMERMSERHIWFAVGGETFDLTSTRPIHWKRQIGDWEQMRLTHGPMGSRPEGDGAGET